MTLARVDDYVAKVVVPAPRVLHVCAGNLYGGVETCLRAMALHRASAQMEYAFCFEGRIAQELRAAGATVHMLGAARFRSPRSVLAVRAALGRVLADGRHAVVVVHNGWPHALFAPVVRRHGAELVHYMHNPPDSRGWIDRWASTTQPSLVVCNSVYTRDAGQWLFPEAPRRVIHCPVVLDTPGVTDREKKRGALGATESDIVVVIACRMQDWKGHRVLLAALAELRSDPRWVCWVAGAAQRPSEEAYEAELRSAVTAAGFGDRIRFLGQRDDVPEILRAADIHCQPNTSPEPFGIAFVEALAAGLPVVTTALGGALEIVDASCGVLVPPGQVAPLAASLAVLLGDPERRAALSKMGPARAYDLCDPATRTGELAGALADVVATSPMDARARAALSEGKSDDAVHAAVVAVVRSKGAHHDSVVDIGCGRGECARRLLGTYGTYVGCDVVRYDGFPQSSSIAFVPVDLNAPPFPLADASASVVVCIETIEHLENPRTVVREMARIVRPRGWIVVTTPNQISLASKLHLAVKDEFQAFQRAPGLYPAHITALVPEDLRRIAAESGLADIEILYTDHGRIPFSRSHWPAAAGARGPWFSDNVILVARRR